MKPLQFLTLCALAAAYLAGCGPKPFCDRQKEALDRVDTKVADCPTMKEGLMNLRPADGKCEALYDKCSADDNTVLDDMVACLDDLPTCTPDAEMETWAPKALACQSLANSLSTACFPITQP